MLQGAGIYLDLTELGFFFSVLCDAPLLHENMNQTLSRGATKPSRPDKTLLWALPVPSHYRL